MTDEYRAVSWRSFRRHCKYCPDDRYCDHPHTFWGTCKYAKDCPLWRRFPKIFKRYRTIGDNLETGDIWEIEWKKVKP